MPFEETVQLVAASDPHRPAFVINGQTRTYGQLNNHADRISWYLTSFQGSRAARPLVNGVESLVAICFGNALAFPEVFLAATRSPFAAAVVDPNMTSTQIRDIFERLEPDLIMVDDANSEIAAMASGMGLNVGLAASIRDAVTEPPMNAAEAGTSPGDDMFLVNFTSGTTSVPKAFTRSRRSWQISLDVSSRFFEVEHGPATLCPGSLSHGLALYALAETLYCGGTYHTVGKWNPAAAAEVLRHQGIERLIAVPTMISALSQHADTGFTQVKEVLTAGSKVNTQHVEAMAQMFPNARIREYYGASELGFVSCATLRPNTIPTSIQSVGHAFPEVTLKIEGQDWQNGRSTEPGVIYVNSPFLCDGYLWGDDGAAFRVNAAGATVGDIGKIDPHGALWVLGREGGMIVTGGNNVYPAEVERALEDIDGLESAIVLGLDDNYLGQRLVAVFSGPASIDAIHAQMSAALPRYKQPRDFYHVARWPLTTRGKIARKTVMADVKAGAYERLQPPA